MPITLTPFKHDTLVQGHTWIVDDETELARHIASVALGQSWHVQRILAGSTLATINATDRAAAGAIKLLTAEDDKAPWHRDGWMFQVISWVAAYKADPTGLIRTPHMIHAHKGFDGLQLRIDAAGNVIAAVIFEDKATVNPRETIHDDVWPEFRAFESGDRENELTAEVAGLLSTRPSVNPDTAIQNIIWQNARQYRISITVGATHSNENGRRKLFKGYDEVANGNIQKRQGETIYLPNLRNWMQALAEKSILELKKKVK